ncbi:PREDICTED: NKG2D ligand 1-like [Propithecus coquereli]|uniref:NKG2D ligand 1-like n=1 Tax=Propithecus coquereli TaxID=379532 RepID=UPI00063FA213|nr:PREDICTED: NKG2D ligand 1-like [Propithecus coquereli]
MEILTNVAEDLRKKLLDIQRENDTPLGTNNFTVKVRMSCQHEANGHTNGSWQFHFNGQEFLVFGSESRKWTLAHPGARHMKEKWENDMDVTKFFHNILIGDCKTLLTKFLLHWEKLLQPTAPPTEAPGTAQPKARATRSICCSLTLLLPCSILLAVKLLPPSPCERGLVHTLPCGRHLSSTCCWCPDLQEFKASHIQSV